MTNIISVEGDIHSVNCSYTYLPPHSVVNIGQTFLAQLLTNTLCKIFTCKILFYSKSSFSTDIIQCFSQSNESHWRSWLPFINTSMEPRFHQKNGLPGKLLSKRAWLFWIYSPGCLPPKSYKVVQSSLLESLWYLQLGLCCLNHRKLSILGSVVHSVYFFGKRSNS